MTSRILRVRADSQGLLPPMAIVEVKAAGHKYIQGIYCSDGTASGKTAQQICAEAERIIVIMHDIQGVTTA